MERQFCFFLPLQPENFRSNCYLTPTSTHQGVSLATTKQVRRDELVVFCLFPPTIYTSLYSYVLSTVSRKSKFYTFLFVLRVTLYKSSFSLSNVILSGCVICCCYVGVSKLYVMYSTCNNIK